MFMPQDFPFLTFRATLLLLGSTIRSKFQSSVTIDPQTSMIPKVRDGESIGSKKVAPRQSNIALLCDAQSSPPPAYR